MADAPHGPGPRVVRLSVSRPATTALAALVVAGALLLGGGSAPGPSSAGASAAPTGPAVSAEGSSRHDDWDVTQRDLLVGQRDQGALAFVQVVATRLGAAVATGAATSVAAIATPPGATQVPEVLWAAYRSAASSVPTSCHLPVGLLAAIGQVESGSLAGRGLDAGHRAVPAVLGPVLDGNGYAAIADTDGGRLDHDTTWDRAVGPMQFIPSTWARWGRDGNGDGARDPQNVEDSAWSAAAYLCAGGRDLSTGSGLRSAVLSYNHSAAYLADVLRLGRTMTPGGGLPEVAAAPGWTPPPPLVGPPSPSRPPVVAAAAARPTGDASSATPTGRTTARPTTSSSTASHTSTTTTTSRTTPPTTTTSTTTTSATTTSSSSSTASPTSSTTTPSSSSTTCPTGTASATTTSGGSGTTTTSPTSTASSSSTSTPDPCATSPTSGPSTTTGTATPSGTGSTSSSAAPATATTTSTEGPSAG